MMKDQLSTGSAASTPASWQHHYGPHTAVHAPDADYPTLGAICWAAARRSPEAPAYSCVLPNGSWGTLTYAQLDAASDAFAGYLRGTLGIAAGDVVAIQGPNCLAWPVAFFGAQKAGCITTGVNPLYTAAEMQHQLSDSGARVLVVIDLFGDKVDAVLKATQVRHVVVFSVAEFFSAPKRALVSFVQKHLRRQVPRMRSPAVSMSRALVLGAARRNSLPGGSLHGAPLPKVALYQYTGGTTGTSKGAMVSHEAIIRNIPQVFAMLGDDVGRGGANCLMVLPLYHAFALGTALVGMPVRSNHTVLIPSPRPISNLRPALERFPPQILPAVNTLYKALLAEPWFRASPPTSLSACFGGGGPIHPSVSQAWSDLTGTTIVEMYGLTEGMMLTANAPAARRTGTVGVPLPGIELALLDEAGHPVPVGTSGEVATRGPNVMLGYLGQATESADQLRDGWLRTGDIGVFDKDGFLSIVDRKKDMVLVSGFNVYPTEVEEVLALHPGVREVAVVGVMDANTGEAVKAFISRADPTLTEQAMREHAATQLTNYKRPKHYVFLDELPKSAVGKILRRELREPMSQAASRT
jgi:long-chain acyl-CoA synthetase